MDNCIRFPFPSSLRTVFLFSIIVPLPQYLARMVLKFVLFNFALLSCIIPVVYTVGVVDFASRSRTPYNFQVCIPDAEREKKKRVTADLVVPAAMTTAQVAAPSNFPMTLGEIPHTRHPELVQRISEAVIAMHMLRELRRKCMLASYARRPPAQPPRPRKR